MDAFRFHMMANAALLKVLIWANLVILKRKTSIKAVSIYKLDVTCLDSQVDLVFRKHYYLKVDPLKFVRNATTLVAGAFNVIRFPLTFSSFWVHHFLLHHFAHPHFTIRTPDSGEKEPSKMCV